MVVSCIVAADEENVIGKDNKLIWHLPADLRRFKTLTMGHHLLMGRKTYESIGKPLPGRTFVIITRQKNYKAEGCIVVNSVEKALEAAAGDSEVFIIGGADIYRQTLPFTNRIYLTVLHCSFEGDTYFPGLDEDEWDIKEQQQFEPDEKNKYRYTFLTLERKTFSRQADR